MKLAGAMVAQNYDPRYGTFKCLKSLCDFTVVLDDNSTQVRSITSLLSEKPDEHLLLTRPLRSLWNDTGNRTMLMYRAYLADCKYVLPWSADVLPSAALFKWILNMTQSGGFACYHNFDFFQCELREVWNSLDTWRSDGRWSDKRNVFLQRNWFFDSNYKMPEASGRLHAYPWGHNGRKKTQIFNMPKGFSIYHFGGMTPEQQTARVAKYAIEDAGNHFQADYKDLADETGLEFSAVPHEDQDFFKRWMTPV